MTCFVSFRGGSRPKVYQRRDSCSRIIGKVLKGRVNIGGSDVKTYSPGRGLFQVSIEGGTSYLTSGDRILSAPKGAVFVHALLPVILPRLYPFPRSPEIIRIVRVLYPRMIEFLPQDLATIVLRLRKRNPWNFLSKQQMSVISAGGGRPVFLPVLADRSATARRYKMFKVEQHFGYAVQRVSGAAEQWYDRLSTVGDIKTYELCNCRNAHVVMRLTAPVSDPPFIKLPAVCVDELIQDIADRSDEWLPFVHKTTLSNIKELFV